MIEDEARALAKFMVTMEPGFAKWDAETRQFFCDEWYDEFMNIYRGLEIPPEELIMNAVNTEVATLELNMCVAAQATTKDVVCKVYEIDRKLYTQMEELCKTRGIRQPDFIRAAIEEKLNRMGTGD